MRGQKKRHGFTLLEVMLAMSLLSVMVVLLFASLRIAAESWDAGENKIAQVNEKAVVYHFFKRHLLTALPLWDEFSSDERRFSFIGERDRLQFVSVFPASAGRKGLHIFEVGPDKREQGVITVKLTPFYPTAENEEWEAEEVVLLEHVDDFEITYFGQDPDEGGWMDVWQDKEVLPQLIKIKISLEDESYWPEMIFAPKLTGFQSDGVINTGISPDQVDAPSGKERRLANRPNEERELERMLRE